MASLKPRPPVWVVSWVYWNGDEPGGGGFDWYYSLSDAREAFEREKTCWSGMGIRVRLVPVSVNAQWLPEKHCEDAARLCEACAVELTNWLDAHIEAVEVDLPSLAVYISDGREAAQVA